MSLGCDKPAKTVISGDLERINVGSELIDEFPPSADSYEMFSGPAHLWYDNIFPMDAAQNTISSPGATQKSISASATVQ